MFGDDESGRMGESRGRDLEKKLDLRVISNGRTIRRKT